MNVSEKKLNARVILKHETEANWKLAVNFIPKKGEAIVYDIDDTYNYERLKIGDGVTNVNSLPFINKQIQNVNELPAENIDDTKIYCVIESVNSVVDGKIVYLSSGKIWDTFQLVDELPETGSNSIPPNVYYNKADGRAWCYISPEWAAQAGSDIKGWNLASDIMSDFSIPWGDVIYSLDEAIESDYYYILVNRKFYVYLDQWIEIITEETLSVIEEVAELPKNASLNKFYKLITAHLVYDGALIEYEDTGWTKDYVVDELPEQPYEISIPPERYYSLSDHQVYCYFSPEMGIGNLSGWETASDCFYAWSGSDFNGIIYSLDEAQGISGYHMLISSKMYYYDDDWKEVVTADAISILSSINSQVEQLNTNKFELDPECSYKYAQVLVTHPSGLPEYANKLYDLGIDGYKVWQLQYCFDQMGASYKDTPCTIYQDEYGYYVVEPLSYNVVKAADGGVWNGGCMLCVNADKEIIPIEMTPPDFQYTKPFHMHAGEIPYIGHCDENADPEAWTYTLEPSGIQLEDIVLKDNWELINSITLTENAVIKFTTDLQGNPFSLKKYQVRVTLPAVTSATIIWLGWDGKAITHTQQSSASASAPQWLCWGEVNTMTDWLTYSVMSNTSGTGAGTVYTFPNGHRYTGKIAHEITSLTVSKAANLTTALPIGTIVELRGVRV